MRVLLVSAFLLSCSSQPAAPEPPEPPTKSLEAAPTRSPEAKAPAVFPADWVGRWHGNVVARSGAKSREFGMILDVVPREEGRYQWKITYALDDGDNVRDYELVPIDAKTGAYQIDEKNGIVINATFAGQTLYTLFDVGGPVVDIRYTMTDAGIIFDVVSALPQKATTTGGGDVPEVKNLPINGVQRALLVKLADAPAPQP